jgi:hypothetical protein
MRRLRSVAVPVPRSVKRQILLRKTVLALAALLLLALTRPVQGGAADKPSSNSDGAADGTKQGAAGGNRKSPGREEATDPLAAQKTVLEKAERFLEAKNYADAATGYQLLAKDPGAEGTELAATARKRLAELNAMARAGLVRATTASEEKNVRAELRELVVILREFPQSDCVNEARRRFNLLRDLPEIRAELDLREAMDLQKAGELRRAVEAYRAIVQNPDYQSTQFVKPAAARLEALTKDPKAQAAVAQETQALADKEGPELLDLAKQLVRNDNYERAAAKYKEIIDRFPGTRYAEEAKKELEKLR